MRSILIYSLIITILTHCNSQVPIDDIEQTPEVTEADKAFKNIYQSLDGEWKGEFIIFEDTARTSRDESLLLNVSAGNWENLPLKKVSSLQVKQMYQSLTPYFQKVEIRDYYPESEKTVVSHGVNKVQDGQMWCVVRKPDETVIHRGRKEGTHTIIWQRNEQNPPRIEYFRETVEAETYRILGWGYYEGDDISLMPKLWFRADYERVK